MTIAAHGDGIPEEMVKIFYLSLTRMGNAKQIIIIENEDVPDICNT